MNALIHKLVIVTPPEQWVKWGLVPAGTYWTLDRAVYGLRESPKLWGDERDKQLRAAKWEALDPAADPKATQQKRCNQGSARGYGFGYT